MYTKEMETGMRYSKIPGIILATVAMLLVSVLTLLAGATPSYAETSPPPSYNRGTRVVDGVTLHEEKIYTKAEVDKIVKDAAVKKQSKDAKLVAQAVAASGMYQVGERQMGPRACTRYSADGKTCLQGGQAQGICPLAYLRWYWDGYQNMARTDHSGNSEYYCPGDNTNGIRAYTQVRICRAQPIIQGNGDCIDPQDWDRNWDRGYYQWYAGPRYSGASRANCISVWGGIDWRYWWDGAYRTYSAQARGVNCG